jgi:hypothetical protein
MTFRKTDSITKLRDDRIAELLLALASLNPLEIHESTRYTAVLPGETCDDILYVAQLC